MIRVVQKKSYSKKKADDYILKRKLKFIYSRVLKIFYIVAAIFLVAIVIWVAKYGGDEKLKNFAFSQSNKFFISLGMRVNSLVIEGNKSVPTDLILKKTIESLGGDVSDTSLMLVNLDRLEDDITSIGWIKSADVRKKMPDTLIIRITERSPKVIWQNSGFIWLADENGDLLTQKMEKKYIYLPVIIGQNPKKDIPELFNIVNSSEKMAKMFNGATKVGGRRWDIKLNNGVFVKLPEKDASRAWQKLEELDKKHAVLSKKINYIDLRIENQLVTGLDKETPNEPDVQKKE